MSENNSTTNTKTAHVNQLCATVRDALAYDDRDVTTQVIVEALPELLIVLEELVQERDRLREVAVYWRERYDSLSDTIATRSKPDAD